MNQSYRLVFNRARGMLVPVEETASASGKSGAGESAVFATVAAALLVGVGSAYAQIVPAGANAPKVISTANGLPQVNIQKPTGAGVSVNSYSQFDVQKNGVVLNNSATPVSTQLAGYINGNPNFAPGQAAKIIVNQVSSANATQFNGPAEIAGQAATFVLANPNGISVNGGNFINTNRAVLTTGTPVIDSSGALAGYNVTGGNITVQGAGFNAANIDQVDLIARSVQINAALYANTLNAVTGTNYVDHATLAATPIAGNGAPSPVSIDVSQLGGMYAGKIVLSSNEHGVGVSNEGVIAAQAGDFTLTADGLVTLTGRTTASGNVILNASQGISNSGTTYAQQSLVASTGGALVNSGTMAAQGSTTASAGSIASTGAFGAGVDNNGNVSANPGAGLNLSASGQLSATGQNVAGSDASITGAGVNLSGSETAANGNLTLAANSGDLNLAGARTSAGGALGASAAGTLANDHGTMTGGSVTLNAGAISNQGGSVSAQGPLVAQTPGAMANQGGTFVSQGAMQVHGGAVTNTGGATMQAGGAFSLAGTSLDNTGGQILSLNGDGLNLGVTGALVNGIGGVIGGNGNVSASAYTFTNAGQLSAVANAVLRAWGFSNSGTITAGGALSATASGALSNTGGTIAAATSTTLSGASIDNTRGDIEGATVAVSTPGDLINEGGSILQSGTANQTVQAGGRIDNANGGNIASNAANLSISGASVDNDAGTIQHAGSGTLDVGANGANGTLSNVSGTIAANGSANLHGANVDNTRGSAIANQGLALTAQTLTNNAGKLGAGASMTVNSGFLTNAGGSIIAPTLTLTTGGTLDNSQGDIEANQLALTAANLLNHGGAITQYGTATMGFNVAGTFDNSAGGTLQTNAADATLAPGALDNDGGTITHAGTGTLTVSAGNDAGAVSNAGGTIQGNGKIALNAGALNNTAGAVVAQQGLAAMVGGTLDNANGKLLSNTDLTANSGTLNNNGGQIGANASATVQAQSLTNSGGSMVAPVLTVTTGGMLDNSGGDIGANALSLSAHDLINHNGSITQYGLSSMGLNVTGTFDNSAGGTLQTNATDAMIAPGALDNDGGTITHAGTGTLSVDTGAGAVSNAGGTIQGNGKIALDAGALNNAAGAVIAQQGLVATVGGALDNTNGKLLSNTGLGVTGGTLNNDGGQIGANTSATVEASTLTNEGGSIVAPQLMVKTGGTLDNSGGDIAANQLALSASDLLNHGGAITQYGTATMGFNVSGAFDNSAGGTLQTNATDATLAPGALDNDGGTITHAGTGTLSVDTGAGAVSNAGGTIQGNGKIALNAGAFNNAAGTVVAQQGLTATVGGTLNNTNGKLLSNTELIANSATLNNNGGQIGANASATVQAQSLTNSGGSMVAPVLTVKTGGTLDNSGGDIEANALSLSANDLINHDGSITQYGLLSMGLNVAGTFDNSAGGTLQTNSTDFTLTPGALDNDRGSILHAGTGTFTLAPGNGAGSLSNVGGRIISAGEIEAQAASVNNAGGVLAAQGDITSTVAGDVNNANGAIRALGSETLNAGGTLTNTNGQIQSGTGQAGDASALSVHAASVDDTDGLIGNLGTGDTTVQAANAIGNSGGVITGNGKVAVDGAQVANTQGGQISGADVSVQGGTLDNSNGLIGNFAGSSGNVAVTAVGGLTNTNGQIGSTNDLNVNAAALTGGGSYSAAHDVAVSVQGDFTPTQELAFAAGHDLTFTLPGTFTNGATLEAANNLGINAGDIANSGVMMAGGTLTTHSNTLANTGAIIGGSVSLNATQSITNVGPTALIGATDSNGTLELLASDIENRDDTTATDTMATTAIYGLGKVVLAGGKDANGNYTSANLIRNQSALIESAGDMTLDAAQVTNTRTTMTTTGLNQSVDPDLLEQLGITLTGCTAIVAAACDPGHPYVGWVLSGDPDAIGGAFPTPPHGGQWNSGYQYTTYTGEALANLIAGISPQAQIIAGGNLDTSKVGVLQNYWSAIATASNMTAPVALDQNSWKGQLAPEIQVTYSGYYHYTNYDHSIADWTLPFGNVPFNGSNPGGYQIAPADVKYYGLPDYESTLTIGGTLSGTGISINNTAGNAGIPSLGLAAGQALSGVTIGGISGSAGTNAGAASSVSGSAGTNAGAASSVSGSAGANAGAASSVSGNAGGAKSGATKVNGSGMVDPTIAAATAQTVLQNLTIPQGGLFRPSTAPGSTYLVEGNPAFTNAKNFISSDYYLQQLGLNPQTTERRLGDGMYEQQLVRDQITKLTGKALLGPYTDAQSLYQSLLAAGASLSQSLDLPLGMSLSPDQVAALTSNVVIMQTEVVDGQSVLVPVVYLAKASQENFSGPLIAANDIDLQNAQTFTNSGTVKAGNTLSIQGNQIDNAFGTLQSGGLTKLTTTGNIDLTSATVNAGSLAVNAGGDLLLNTAVKTVNQVSATGATRTTTTLGPIANVNVTGDASIVTGGNVVQNAANLNVGGNLGMAVGGNYEIGSVQTGEHKVVTGANGVSDTNLNQTTGSSIKVGGVSQIGVGGDLTATGASINLGGGGVVAANGNVTLQAAKATSSVDSNSSGSDSHGSYSESMHLSSDSLTGTTLNAGNSLTVASGKDINVNGSAITLDKGTATLAAAGDVNIGAASATYVDNTQEQHQHSNVVSGKEVRSSSNSTATVSQGSLVSADSVSVSSGKDINVLGSTIVGTNDVEIQAAHDVNITTTQDSAQSSGTYEEKRTGFGTSGLTVTVGSNKLATTNEQSSVTNNASTVGSLSGDLSIQAGNTLHVTGSDLLAGGNLAGTAANVIIDSATDTAHQAQTQKQSSSGLSIGLSGSVGDAINNAYSQGRAIGESAGSGNERAAALHAIATAGDTAIAGMGASALTGGATGPQAPGIGVQVSIGSSKSQSQSSEDQTIQRGSNVQAGGTAAFVATGSDLTIAGSNVSANDVVLAAKDKVNIVNTTNTDSTRSSNSASSASFGVSVGTNGVGISATMANAHGDGNSDAAIQNASHVTGANRVAIASGGDTNIIGSQVTGNQIAAAVGGNLNVTSVQDVTSSAAHQSSAGGGFSISTTGGSASFSAQNGHADASYAGVNEQAGILAGNGGFDVAVQGNTALTGAVISSTADASKNSLTTGTLSYSDIQNRSHYDANSNGISAGVGVGNTGKAIGPGSVSGTPAVTPMISQNENGDSSATTRSAVSAGTINVTNAGAQVQDVANLSRDTTNTNGTVAATPNVQNILSQQADTMQAAQAAGQVVAQGIGAYADNKREAASKAGDQATAAAWDEGGDNRTALHIAGGALIGGLGGGALDALGGAAGAGVASAMARDLDRISNGVASETGSPLIGNLAANIVAGLGGAVVGGTAGAATASNVDLYNRQLDPKEKTLAKQLADKSGGKYTEAQIEDQMRIMGVSDNGTNESGAPTTLIGQSPTDSGAKWISGGATANGQPILTQLTTQADPQLQSYITANYNSASPGQVPSQFTYQQSGSGSTNITGPFTQFDQSDANYVRGTIADTTSMISTNAGRISALAAAGGSITPCSAICDGIAFAGTVVGTIADAVGQLAKPDAGQYLFNGSTALASNAISLASPPLTPVVNELVNQVNGSGVASNIQDSVNKILGPKTSSGKQ
ncbi:hemagglutinin repeat-containing protein [Paraburkholderia bannensis]|uniref:hemagglutinin repeat-containing protein n=1 Tax=Paraburkholderia bannensis TaxID=765414 RepID=UPI0006939CC5|nr:hemagglutinin repeat-containing protein [Paraburkholderia bannensis]